MAVEESASAMGWLLAIGAGALVTLALVAVPMILAVAIWSSWLGRRRGR